MPINKIDPSSKLQAVSGAKKLESVKAKSNMRQNFNPDVIEITADSRHAQADKIAFIKAWERIAQTPDIREDKVIALKKNPSSYTQPTSEILQAVAENLIKDFIG